jgi:hypothetical protein
MLTLSYGYKLPQTNDKGPTVFPALENNIQQLNDHNHDGANSAQLTTQSLISQTQTILAANWVSLGNGNYHQNVNLLAGYNYDLSTLSFRSPTGEYLYPSVTKVSTTVFDVTTNDPSIGMTILYGV